MLTTSSSEMSDDGLQSDEVGVEMHALGEHELESLEWDFAAVVAAHELKGEAFEAKVLAVGENLVRAGFEIALVESTDATWDSQVLLLRCPDALLRQEWHRLQRQRFFQYGGGVTLKATRSAAALETDEQPTRADRIQIISELLDHGAGYKHTDHAELLQKQDPHVKAIFPLKDEVWATKFVRKYSAATAAPAFLARQTLRAVKQEIGLGEALRLTIRRNDWFIDELRFHYGERVAVYFAFIDHYNTVLAPLSLAGVVFQLVIRYAVADYDTFLRALSLFGMFTAWVWGPSVIQSWRRRSYSLMVKWGLSEVQEDNAPNPHYKERSERAQLGGLAGALAARGAVFAKRLLVAIELAFILASCIAMCVFTLCFALWYVQIKGMPECNRCCTDAHGYVISMNSTTIPDGLGTQAEKDAANACIALGQADECRWIRQCMLGPWDRLAYVLANQILLALALDLVFMIVFQTIATKFTRLENIKSNQKYEEQLTIRTYGFVWFSFFAWFLILAIVFIPYAEKFSAFLGTTISPQLAFVWDRKTIQLDTCFVVPLVLSQAVGLIADTLVPQFLRKQQSKLEAKARAASSITEGSDPAAISRNMSSFSGALAAAAGIIKERATETSVADLARKASEKFGADVSVITQWGEGPEPAAVTIIAESELPVLENSLDYLDLGIQFSYITMFTIAWPIAPLLGSINNFFEIRADAYRCLVQSRRPIPTRPCAAKGAIGAWMQCFYLETLVSLSVVSLLFSLSTGQAEAWLEWLVPGGECQTLNASSNTTDTVFMGPNLQCFGRSSSGWRWFVAMAMEHLGFLVVYLVYNNVPSAAASDTKSMESKNTSQRQLLTDAVFRQEGQRAEPPSGAAAAPPPAPERARLETTDSDLGSSVVAPMRGGAAAVEDDV